MSTSKQKPAQQSKLFEQSREQLSHGGTLRQKAKGRGRRPLSTNEPLHVVFKANRSLLRHRSLRSSPGFPLCRKIIDHYGRKFFVKVEQVSIQHDHIHCLIRTTRRSQFQSFFRVVAGQIAQRFARDGLLKEPPRGSGMSKGTSSSRRPRADMTDTLKGQARVTGTQTGSQTDICTSMPTTKWTLWLYRPFSRVVRGWRAYKTVRNYIQLNEKEVLGVIPYRKERLRGLSSSEWSLLWA